MLVAHPIWTECSIPQDKIMANSMELNGITSKVRVTPYVPPPWWLDLWTFEERHNIRGDHKKHKSNRNLEKLPDEQLLELLSSKHCLPSSSKWQLCEIMDLPDSALGTFLSSLVYRWVIWDSWAQGTENATHCHVFFKREETIQFTLLQTTSGIDLGTVVIRWQIWLISCKTKKWGKFWVKSTWKIKTGLP